MPPKFVVVKKEVISDEEKSDEERFESKEERVQRAASPSESKKDRTPILTKENLMKDENITTKGCIFLWRDSKLNKENIFDWLMKKWSNKSKDIIYYIAKDTNSIYALIYFRKSCGFKMDNRKVLDKRAYFDVKKVRPLIKKWNQIGLIDAAIGYVMSFDKNFETNDKVDKNNKDASLLYNRWKLGEKVHKEGKVTLKDVISVKKSGKRWERDTSVLNIGGVCSISGERPTSIEGKCPGFNFCLKCETCSELCLCDFTVKWPVFPGIEFRSSTESNFRLDMMREWRRYMIVFLMRKFCAELLTDAKTDDIIKNSKEIALESKQIIECDLEIEKEIKYISRSNR